MIQIYRSKFHSNSMDRKKFMAVLVWFPLVQIHRLCYESIDENPHTVNRRLILWPRNMDLLIFRTRQVWGIFLRYLEIFWPKLPL